MISEIPIYLIGIVVSVIIIAYFNKRVLRKGNRMGLDTAVIFSIFWPIGLPVFFIVIFLAVLESEYSIIKKLKKFIEGDE